MQGFRHLQQCSKLVWCTRHLVPFFCTTRGNPGSLARLIACRLEPALGAALPGTRYQFERNGYFCVDAKDSAPGRPVWNRTVPLRDSWAKIEKAGRA